MTSYLWDGAIRTLPDRDSQKAKVYLAEREAFKAIWNKPNLGNDKAFIQELVDGITEGRLWEDLRGRSGRRVRRVRVEMPNRLRLYAWGGGGRITLPPWARCTAVMLHEMAHCAATSLAAHHWPFCFCYLALVREYMGHPWHEQLRDAFKKHRVRYKPKSQARVEAGRRLAANQPPRDLMKILRLR